jgi:hypothetical protein
VGMNKVITTVFVALLALSLALTSWPSPTLAVPRCGTHEAMIDTLRREYGEIVVSIGILSNGALTETLVNVSTKSWTILTTFPGNLTCIAAHGSYWSTVEPKEGKAI